MFKFNNYMTSKSCQIAATLIPKFKLNWTAQENREEIKQALIECISVNISTNITSSQESNQTSSSTEHEHFENCEDDFLSFKENKILYENNDIEMKNKSKKSVILWQMHASPKESMRVIINDRLVASENTLLTREQWNHVCFQWKGFTGIWAVFVNAKVHSVGQVPSNNMSAATWKLYGKGVGILGDDGASSRNAWQAYGLYMTGGPPVTGVRTSTGVVWANVIGSDAGKSETNRKANRNSKRQAVLESDPDDSTTGTGGSSSKPFQWFAKSFAFIKRMFTFVIIPFFKFVRNTFFQTRSLDDTVVDVSETHLTISDVKFEPPADNATVTGSSTVDDLADIDTNKVERRPSSSKRETDSDGGRCGGLSTDDERVTDTDLVASDTPLVVGDAVSSAAKRYLRVVTDGLNDVSVNVAFVRRTFACCSGWQPEFRADVVIDWDRSRSRPHSVTLSPHACGRL